MTNLKNGILQSKVGFEVLHLKYSRHWPIKDDFFIQYILGTVKNCRNIPKLLMKYLHFLFFNFELWGNVLVTKIVNFLLNLYLHSMWVYAHFGRFKQNVGPSGVKANQVLTDQIGGC